MKIILIDIAIASIAVFTPIKPMLLVVGFLILIDLFTGILRSLKVREKITSTKLRRTIGKMLAYQLAIITGFVLEKYLIDGMVPVAKMVAAVIGITEFKSILENTEAITEKKIFKDIIEKFNGKREKDK